MKKTKFIAGLCLIGQSILFFILFLVYWNKSRSLSRSLAVFSAVGGLAGAYLVFDELRNKKISREMEEDFEDYDFIDERHWLPGEGKVDWRAVYKTLVDGGYQGAWMYEVGFATPTKTLHRPRNLTCADFVRNAREIFAGKPITVIGTPHPGLGMNVW